MVEEPQELLEGWIGSVRKGVRVSYAPPPATPADALGVSLYLVELRRPARLGAQRPDRLELALAYLVTASAKDPAEAHDLLIELCFSAMEQPDLDVDLDPAGVALWQSLGLPPRPSFRLVVPLRRKRQRAAVAPVLRPLAVRAAALAAIAGRVRTPDDVAVPNAAVEIPALDRRATTDRRGRFLLDGVPGPPAPLSLRVRARGREVTYQVGPEEDRSSLLVTMNPLEALDG